MNMKLVFILLISLITPLILAQDLTFTANKRLIEPIVNNEVKPENTVEIKYSSVKPITGSKLKYQWVVNGSSTPGKGWELVKNTGTTSDKLKIYFNKLGNYSISLTVTAINKVKNGDETEEVETEYVGEAEEFITVRSVFPELAALYAQKPKPNYVKLVEKASEYVVKPKYSNDPTPNLFLAKGYLGVIKSQNPDPRFESAMEECVSSFNAARELDKNGVMFDNEHQAFLTELETYIYAENIKDNVDADPKNQAEEFETLIEYLDYYSQISYAPITSTFLQAYIKFIKKDVKGANLIWTTETAKFKKYTNLDEETTYGKKFKDELGNLVIISQTDLQVLKFGVMKSASIMKTRDGNAFKACELLELFEPLLIDDRGFAQFYNTEFNSCSKKKD